MLLIEIDFQKEKKNEHLFFGLENNFVDFNVGDIICLNFDKLIISDFYSLNDFDRFREKIYSKAIIEKIYLIENFSPIYGSNQEVYFTSEFYVIEWENGELMHISQDDLGKFIKYI